MAAHRVVTDPSVRPQAVPGTSELVRTPFAEMIVDWDIEILMDDGLALRADVYRPVGTDRAPVILSYGPYAKWLDWELGYPSPWQNMIDHFPDALEGTSNRFHSWEVVDPEKWVPAGYACVRVDSRGSGRSPGVVDPLSVRETDDLFACIEWAGVQEWSNGRVGLAGISYYAINQWQVAARKPPHLAAICPWEGASDFYRDSNYHGGIPTTFWKGWYGKQCRAVQHGLGSRGYLSNATGGWVSGDAELSDAELEANRVDFAGAIEAHPFDDAYHRERSGDPAEIEVPILSSGNWGGQGLHLRGNTYGWEQAPRGSKWLEMHGGPHWAEFYTDYGVALQRAFFDRFLKGVDNGWDRRPPVLLNVRHVDGRFSRREEQEWPLARTEWTTRYLDPERRGLTDRLPAPSTTAYTAQHDEVTFRSEPFDRETEITGPLVAKLFVSSETVDADLFLTVRVHSPEGEEVVFQGALDPHTPIAQGWLRASHRAVDASRSTAYRPYHPHTEAVPLAPNEIVELDIEILPTSLVIPAGYTLSLTVSGSDYVYPGEAATLSMIAVVMSGCGPFIHPDRDDARYRGRVTIHSGPETPSSLVLPVIPPTAA